MQVYNAANFNMLSTQLVSPLLKECSVHNTKRYIHVHVQLLLTYLQRPSPGQPCHRKGGRHSTTAFADDSVSLKRGDRGESDEEYRTHVL